jgi:hypothetical protein
MEFVITPAGVVRCVYGEELDLRALGRPAIRRGSHVEPTADGHWTADLAPVGGPLLGPFEQRCSALEAEIAWLGEHWLGRAEGPSTA